MNVQHKIDIKILLVNEKFLYLYTKIGRNFAIYFTIKFSTFKKKLKILQKYSQFNNVCSYTDFLLCKLILKSNLLGPPYECAQNFMKLVKNLVVFIVRLIKLA